MISNDCIQSDYRQTVFKTSPFKLDYIGLKAKVEADEDVFLRHRRRHKRIPDPSCKICTSI